MFLRWLVDGFMHLVADGGGLEIHRTARVLPVFKNTDNGFLVPTVRISRYFLRVTSADRFIVSRGNKDLFFLQLPRNLRWATPCKAKRIDFAYHFGGGLVNQPFLLIIRVFPVPKRNRRRYSIAYPFLKMKLN